MHIGGSIPIHIARAYGIDRSSPVRSAPPLDRAATPGPSRSVAALVTARVDGPIDFSPASIPTTAHGALQLYTRAADRIEAAVAVQVGRTIDVRG